MIKIIRHEISNKINIIGDAMNHDEISDAIATMNFTSAEFRYFINKTGKTITWFRDLYNEILKTKWTTNWFVSRCGSRTVNWHPNQVIESEIPELLLNYLGKERFILIRQGFARECNIEFPQSDFYGVKDTIDGISEYCYITSNKIINSEEGKNRSR